MKTIRPIALCLGALLLLPLVSCASAEGARYAADKAAKPEPENPLLPTVAERERAVTLAAEARTRLYAEATPVAGAEITKEIVTAVGLYPPTDEDDDRRLIAVTSFDYRTGTAARVVVDLTGDRVVEARAIPGSAAPAAREEERRVRELLREDSAAYRALLDAPTDAYDLALFLSTGEEEDELAGHRIVMVRPVYFRNAPRAPIAIVDLTADEVLRYEN